MTYFRLLGFLNSRETLVTVGTIAASIAFVMELTLLPLLLSEIQRDLVLNVGELAWVFNAYAIAVAIAVLSSGLVGDIVDRQKLFAVGVVLFVSGSVLSAFSSSLLDLILSRMLQGFGGGLFSPLVPILLTQASAARSGKILMIWGGLVGVAAALLPAFGNVILTAFGWRAMFVVFALVATAGLTCLIGANSTLKSEGKRRPNYGALLSHPRYWRLLVYIFLTYGCFTFYLFHCSIGWPKNGFSSQMVSIFLTCVWVSFALLNFVLRDRIDGKGLGVCLFLAPILIAASYGLAVTNKADVVMQITAAVLAGAALACSNSPTTHLLLRLAPQDLRAFSSSLDIIFARCGSVAMVALLSPFQGPTVALAILGFSIGALWCFKGVGSQPKPSG